VEILRKFKIKNDELEIMVETVTETRDQQGPVHLTFENFA
jgi:hypothetical protein